MTTPASLPSPLLPRTVVVLLGGAAAVVVIAGMRGMADLIAPAFLALVLTICAHPLRGWLTRHRVPGWLATTAVIVTVYLVLAVLVLSLVVAVARLATLLPTYQDDLQGLANEAADWLKTFGVDQKQIEAVTSAIDPGQALDLFAGVFGSLLGVLSNLFFIVTLLLFLAVDGVALPRMLGALDQAHGRFAGAMSGFAAGTRTYIVVSSVFGLIVAVLDVGLLYLLDIPLPWLWGMLAFITNYIPNIGFVIGLIPPLILGLLENGWGGALAVLVGYCVLNVVIQSVIQPRFVGQAVGLSTSLTFLSLIFWAAVLGPLGALLAIPLSLFARALLVDADPRNWWLIPLLTGVHDPPAPGPPEVAPAAAREDAAGE
ncbi:AI-2E family transporter [Nocardioides sp. GXQ0305]|uniref:AI-2E family transporter n=1 Tax=Nocardioides sp. GXQ0305 TaxID=3423912 RepID=UPI003D7DC18D